MSPTEPHVYLNLDNVQSFFFSDELLSSRVEQKQTRVRQL